MRNVLFASLIVGLFAAASPATAAEEETMAVTATIAPSITVDVAGAIEFGALVPQAAGNAKAVQSFMLTTNTKVDILISAAEGDLEASDAENGTNTLNVTYDCSSDGGNTYTGAPFGEGEASTSKTISDVGAGVHTYHIEATITDEITATTVRGSYTASLTITVTDRLD